MFDKTLKENADETFQIAEKALEKIIDGEVTYQNIRSYIVNLHNSYELYFKWRLLENDVYKLFQYSNYDKFVLKQEKKFKNKKELLECMKDPKVTLPNTVSFKDAIKRLACLYKEEEFTSEFIEKLYKLNDLRNNLTHFECKLGDEDFMLVSGLFIKYSRNYDERYPWGCLSGGRVIDLNQFEEKLKNKKFKNERLKRLILDDKDKFNQNLLKKIKYYPEIHGFWNTFRFSCESIAKDLVYHYEEFSDNDLKKIRKRLEILKYADLIELTEEIIYMDEGKYFNIENVELKNIN